MTVGISDALHARLRERAKRSGTSIRALVIRALEQHYGESRQVTGPLVKGSGKLGPDFPDRENPHDLVISLPDKGTG